MNPLLLGLSQEDARRVLARWDAATADQQKSLLVAVQAELNDRCSRDGRLWLNLVTTRDEADVKSGGKKSFPTHLPYVMAAWDVIDREQRVVVAKSRQMFVSWILSAYAVWTARYHPNSLVVYQTQKWEDAVAMVATPGSAKESGYAGRMQFIEQHLPSWMRQHILTSEGNIDYPNGSRIMALAGGANQIRGKTATLVIEDEFAFQPEAKGVYTAVAPLIQKGCRFVAVSTPNGAEGNLFYHLYHGVAYDV